MRTRIGFLLLALCVVIVAGSCAKMAGPNKGSPNALRVAVVTGGHAFDVPDFYRLFRELPGIDAYPQHIEHFGSSSEKVRDAYDVVLFFGMERGGPPEEGPHFAGDPKAALERVVEQGQGVVVLHHALLAWEEWDFWDQVTGYSERNFRYKPELKLTIEVADDKHAVTQGFDGFETVDEGYVLHGKHDGQGTILLTTQHDDAMEEVAWAREHGNSRVFCLSLGDNKTAWGNAGFREILRRGIVWTADQSAVGNEG